MTEKKKIQFERFKRNISSARRRRGIVGAGLGIRVKWALGPERGYGGLHGLMSGQISSKETDPDLRSLETSPSNP